ncbi:MAG TPA: hypothetical protein VK933_13270, partial [Longimicrobiales bacterium]|nr:hypothetical protein [Longimicrobiales bacterium]
MHDTTPFRRRLALVIGIVTLGGCVDGDTTDVAGPMAPSAAHVTDETDAALRSYLVTLGFTGRVASTV